MMRKNPDRTFGSVLLHLLIPIMILLLAGCSDEDSPVDNKDPLVINDLERWYVNASASGAGDGSSWADAFTSIQMAVDYSDDGDQVWVANGSYFSPEPGDSSVPVLRMKPGVDIYGGFSTADISLEDRDPQVNSTILDGENRTWHVVIGAGQARLDGFIIQSGHAFGTFPDNCGGGMFNHRVSPAVENCVFTSNDAAFHGAGMANIKSSTVVRNSKFRLNLAVNNGAGVYNDDQNGIDGRPQFDDCVFGPGNSCRFGGGMFNNWCEVTVTDCVFRDNLANHNGGGLYNTSSRATVRNCSFTENRAYYGGAVYMNGAPGEDLTILENCLVHTNTAYISGGGVYLYRSSSSIINCTITNNGAIYAGGISSWHSEAEILNSIVWMNTAYNQYPSIEIGTEIIPAIESCDIDQEGYGLEGSGLADSDGNLRLDPLFVTGSHGDWYLSCVAAGQGADSPCIDAGISTDISSWLSGLTTRTDDAQDAGVTDIGYHFSP
jgi:hypothetical protein